MSVPNSIIWTASVQVDGKTVSLGACRNIKDLVFHVGRSVRHPAYAIDWENYWEKNPIMDNKKKHLKELKRTGGGEVCRVILPGQEVRVYRIDSIEYFSRGLF